MKNLKSVLTKNIIAAVAAAALFTPVIASAQDYSNGAGEQIQGTIASIDGTWNITVNDANGYRDSIALHQGTVINPTGLTLEPGMSVTIDGYGNGPDFEAMEIDTPYQYQGPAPVAEYYGPGTWYPGYADGWGPSFSLFFDLNTRRYEQRSFYAGGEARRPIAPPSGWQNRPHGFIGNSGFNRPNQRSYAPSQGFSGQYQGQRTAFIPQQQRTFAPPQQQNQRTFAPQQPQQRNFAPPQRTFAPQQQQQQQQQPQRTFAAPDPQQQRNFAPQQRTFAPPQQQQQPQRTFVAPQPQQQRNFAPPQQQQPQRTFVAPQPQQQRNFAPPQQQQPQRTFAPPQQQQQRAAAPQQVRDYSSPTSRGAR
jgi:hypothetical protein